MHGVFHLIAPATFATAVLMVAAGVACDAADQEAAAPVPKIGDTWRFRQTDVLTRNETDRYTEKVYAVAGGSWWGLGENAKGRWRWRYDAVKATRRQLFEHVADAPDRRGKQIGSADGGFAKRWPLKVGDAWDCSEDTTWPDGSRAKYDLKCRVEAYEPLETAAGRFDTYRIEAKGFVQNAILKFEGRHERSLWYAPAARTDVKREYRSWGRGGQPGRVDSHELVEFVPGD